MGRRGPPGVAGGAVKGRGSTVVLDIAGAAVGGAARWVTELDAYLADEAGAVRVIGRGRSLTASWLVHREIVARRAAMVIAENNASFALRGAHRRVLLG